MDQERFERTAHEGMEMLRAAMSPFAEVLGGGVVAYNAYFGGTEVVVLGYQHQDGEHVVTKPLAILVDAVVFDQLRVDEEHSRVKNGNVEPKRVI